MAENIKNDKRIDEIEVRLAATTEGDWELCGEAVEWHYGQKSPFDDEGAGIVAMNSPNPYYGKVKGATEKVDREVVVGGAQDEQGGAVGILRQEDAEFFANAQRDMRYLLERVADLTGERDHLRAMLDNA